ncbi:MFS transporter-like protein [Rhexocercosporidium sp. MPI-PUGE-AT-0058]|nr:MFS transporter-like protein [Rhexocercosporidium sp. MPI-PUGE-AT-0058]
MAFGILEPSFNTNPRGTTLLENVRDGHRAEVVLVPQPSTSKHDPLNLSKVRKELAFATIILGACFTGVIGPLLVPGFGILTVVFDVEISGITVTNGALVMALGVSAYLCSCFAVVYGKRLVFLFTTVLLIVTCCWGASAKTYKSFLGARIMQGLGMGGFFALAGTASINDLFFVHERGFRVGLWNFAVIVSVNITPIISGYVIVNLSWRWSFWLLVIAFGILLACVVFLFPETTFDRQIADVDVETTEDHIPQSVSDSRQKESLNDEVVNDSTAGTVLLPSSLWSRALGLEHIEIKDQSRIFALCVSPLLLIRHPAIVWGSMMWAVTFTWVIIQGAIATQVFGAPPYSLSATAVGNLVGIAPLIGAALGTLVGGWSCDYISQILAVLNKGVFEPEFRLLIIIPAVVTIAVGGFGLGAAIQNENSAVVCGVFLAFINFSVGIGCTGIVSYTNDVCQEKAGEAFGLAMVIKSGFAFGLTFMLNDYYASKGPLIFFSTWTGLTLGVMFLTIPMYVFGKRIRAWVDEKRII